MPARPCSQVNSLLQNFRPDMTIQLMLRNDIEPASGDLGQPLGQRQSLREQIVASWKIDQKVDIAVRSILAPCYRAKNTNPSRAKLAARGVDHIFLRAQCVKQHDWMSL